MNWRERQQAERDNAGDQRAAERMGLLMGFSEEGSMTNGPTAATATPELEMELPADDTPELEMELQPEPTVAPNTSVPTAPERSLVQILPADFPLPTLIRFVADERLKVRADEATRYALDVKVDGAEGIQRADAALTALRTTLRDIAEHFAEPADIANRLHKQITGLRGTWTASGDAAVTTVGRRVAGEKQRLDALAAAERRRVQDEQDRAAREQRRREADAAEKAKAPAAVVEELKRQAETATAAPVHIPSTAPVMQGSTVVTTWKARLVGTPADAEPNPKVAELGALELAQVRVLLHAILEDKAPISAIEINWSVLNGRAKADKTTLTIPGIEAFADSGVRAKGRRA